jgi:hypothetical protein
MGENIAQNKIIFYLLQKIKVKILQIFNNYTLLWKKIILILLKI